MKAERFSQHISVTPRRCRERREAANSRDADSTLLWRTLINTRGSRNTLPGWWPLSRWWVICCHDATALALLRMPWQRLIRKVSWAARQTLHEGFIRLMQMCLAAHLWMVSAENRKQHKVFFFFFFKSDSSEDGDRQLTWWIDTLFDAQVEQRRRKSFLLDYFSGFIRKNK